MKKYGDHWTDEQKKKIKHNLMWYLGIETVLILLKVFGIISWSWWIVLLPIYGPIVFNEIETWFLLHDIGE